MEFRVEWERSDGLRGDPTILSKGNKNNEVAYISYSETFLKFNEALEFVRKNRRKFKGEPRILIIDSVFYPDYLKQPKKKLRELKLERKQSEITRDIANLRERIRRNEEWEKSLLGK